MKQKDEETSVPNISSKLSKDENTFNDTLISIVIPMYNEEHTIQDIIQKIPQQKNIEVVIVDDGSTDNSIKKVKELNRKVKLIQHEKNKGYGNAILTGFKNITGDIVITMDSDGQHNPKEIMRLISPIVKDQADIVIASRYLGGCQYRVPFYTRFGELLIETLLRLIFRQKVMNNQSGFRAFRKEALKIFNKMSSKSMGFTTEILFKAAYNKLRLMEVPSITYKREFGSSRVKLIRLIKSVISCSVKYYFQKHNLDINKFFLKRMIDKVYRKINYLKVFH